MECNSDRGPGCTSAPVSDLVPVTLSQGTYCVYFRNCILQNGFGTIYTHCSVILQSIAISCGLFAHLSTFSFLAVMICSLYKFVTSCNDPHIPDLYIPGEKWVECMVKNLWLKPSPASKFFICNFITPTPLAPSPETAAYQGLYCDIVHVPLETILMLWAAYTYYLKRCFDICHTRSTNLSRE